MENLKNEEFLAGYLDTLSKRQVFERAFKTHWESIYRSALQKVGSEEAAKDIVQDVFIVLWNKLDELKDRPLTPFLHAVLKNKVLQLFERNAVRLRYVVESTQQPQVAEPCDEPLFEKELDSIIKDEVLNMPPRMQTIYRMKKEEDLSIRDISKSLQISEQTVKNQLYSASERLKAKLKLYNPQITLMLLILFVN
ncbi:RNA polymerase sigma factor [Sphingobacterium gobiense]|uniref:RNA polymerase subunit sigma-70 n=1 Tax=Sphingobacterium gobiense TaxID=1382456 RepID=A0A2S9JRU5_9SPHI|nr:sigma-70 family RNA polymerase sigma factor [Sphingobacterium gobiense]PRD56006.1 hypothetical protein C5749_01565 [Sphingobacterium gobiense]